MEISKKNSQFETWKNNDHSLKLGLLQTMYDILKNYSSSSGEAFIFSSYNKPFLEKITKEVF